MDAQTGNPKGGKQIFTVNEPVCLKLHLIIVPFALWNEFHIGFSLFEKFCFSFPPSATLNSLGW